MKQFAIITIVYCIVIHSALGQDKSSKVRALNDYVLFLNESVQSLNLMYEELTVYNKSLNHFYNYRNSQPVFREREEFKNRIDYMISTDLYEKCIKESVFLTDSDRIFLNKRLDAIVMVLHTIQNARDSLTLLSKQGFFEKGNNIQVAYHYLKQCEKFFEEFNFEKDKLYYEISELYDLYRYYNIKNPYVKTEMKMRFCFDYIDQLYNKILKVDTSGVSLIFSVLDNQAKQLKQNKEINLAGIPWISDISGNDPYYRYDKICEGIRSMQLFVKTFVRKNDSPEKFLNFYNDHMVKRYNTDSLGLMFYYKSFIGFSGNTMLQTVNKPYHFRVVLPDELQKQEDAILAEIERQNNEPELLTITDTSEFVIEDEIEIIDAVVETEQKSEPEIDTTNASPLDGYSPNHLVFLLDVSGSMNSPEKLPVLKDAAKYLISVMRPEDFVSIVSYSGDAEIKLEPTSASEFDEIYDAIDNLKSGGGTNAVKGLRLSYKLAKEHFIENGNNRIILATDGNFDTNKYFYRLIENNSKDNISLSVFYLRRYENKTHAMKFSEIAQKGGGNYIFISPKNAKTSLLNEAQADRH